MKYKFQQSKRKEFIFNQDAARKQLQQAWGKNYEANVVKCAQCYEEFFSEKDKSFLEKSKIVHDPRFLRDLLVIADGGEQVLSGTSPKSKMYAVQRNAAERHILDRIPQLVAKQKNRFIDTFGSQDTTLWDEDNEIEIVDDEMLDSSGGTLMSTGKASSGPPRDPTTTDPMLTYN